MHILVLGGEGASLSIGMCMVGIRTNRNMLRHTHSLTNTHTRVDVTSYT